MFASLLVFVAGCETIYIPAHEASPPPCGLIVIYPGASGVPAEQLAWPIGLRQAGVNEAIEIVSWGRPGDAVFNATAVARHHEWSVNEAQRLARIIDDHPGCPVTLVGYSAGAAMTVFVAESMPPDRLLERVVLLSADLSPQYDLRPALDRTRRGIVSYWSPLDRDTVDLTYVVGTVDGSIGPPAGSVGFETRDERLIQVSWNADMIRFGNFGGHFDYVFNPPWIERFAAEWIRVPQQ